ncbi:hypothetical protein [Mucilaginibacter sp.]|uniref:NHL domain-containing protein n=1 Tax=Mucilaginibacter sp. TaxID=1882438 RepID=UPI00260C9D90|nr:hypothetical protein [Mucilaginibacter sp.]MDB5032349.1 Serine/threonine-protein kinase PknD [Mucilaginibacter sp.]
MKKYNLLLAAIITTCLLSCGKGGSTPAPDNTTTTYTVSTIAGSGNSAAPPADGTGVNASFYFPTSITADPSGNLYVVDGQIRKVTPAGTVSTFAGGTTFGYVDATGTNASFNSIQGIVSDASGNLYVCDNGNYRIRKITPAGVVSTFAGNGTKATVDGPASTASFFAPRYITIDASGNLYVTDAGSIRKITPSGLVSTLINNGYYDRIAADVAGNIYVANGFKIIKITPSGVTSVFAGSIDALTSGFADGTGTNAVFGGLRDITIDPAGNLYVFDNGRIRKINPAGVTTTLAGTGVAGYKDGAASSAQFADIGALTIDASGNIYVVEGNNKRVRKITKQ